MSNGAKTISSAKWQKRTRIVRVSDDRHKRRLLMLASPKARSMASSVAKTLRQLAPATFDIVENPQRSDFTALNKNDQVVLFLSDDVVEAALSSESLFEAAKAAADRVHEAKWTMGYKVVYDVDAWIFGSAAHRRAPVWMKELLSAHECMIFRPDTPFRRYEHDAMVRELIRRCVGVT